jgi:hypothetical protein
MRIAAVTTPGIVGAIISNTTFPYLRPAISCINIVSHGKCETIIMNPQQCKRGVNRCSVGEFIIHAVLRPDYAFRFVEEKFEAFVTGPVRAGRADCDERRVRSGVGVGDG